MFLAPSFMPKTLADLKPRVTAQKVSEVEKQEQQLKEQLTEIREHNRNLLPAGTQAGVPEGSSSPTSSAAYQDGDERDDVNDDGGADAQTDDMVDAQTNGTSEDGDDWRSTWSAQG
mmetsp:Transcript_11698/g.35109  ORF Transcript_11698/g.35109 Transcript_11698/m.35109 type:complete len:116 (-) Transcript_11698:5129-5476(-)